MTKVYLIERNGKRVSTRHKIDSEAEREIVIVVLDQEYYTLLLRNNRGGGMIDRRYPLDYVGSEYDPRYIGHDYLMSLINKYVECEGYKYVEKDFNCTTSIELIGIDSRTLNISKIEQLTESLDFLEFETLVNKWKN